MLLLASVVFGGAGADEAFQFLPEEDAELLKHRTEAFRSIPKEQRIPFLVREMRRLLSMRRRRLATAEPEHLAGLLAKEKPVVAEVVLRALPSLLANSVQAALPSSKKTQLRREPSPEVFSFVRWKLEEELQNASISALFRFEDILGLQARELITVCDRMGARVFATALAGLPSGERQSFFDSLPPDQRILAQKACDAAGQMRPLQANDSRRLLELYGGTANSSSALRSAGVRRIMRACLSESADFASKMARRHEGELGKLLSHWLDEEKGKKVQGDGGRADILDQLEFLAKRGFVERPLVLSKPKIIPVTPPPKAAARAKPAPLGSVPSVGSARLAAPPAMKPSRVPAEKLPKPTPSRLVGPGGERGNLPMASPAANRSHRLPKPHTIERSAAQPPKTAHVRRPSPSPEITEAKRPLPPPKTTEARRPSPPPEITEARRPSPPPEITEARRPSPPPKTAGARRPSPSYEITEAKRPLPLPKAAETRRPSPSPEITEARRPVSPSTPNMPTGKAAGIRMPSPQSAPRRPMPGGAGALRQGNERTAQATHGQRNIGEKPTRKG